MMGAVAGDIIGSPYEANPIKTKDFPLFQRGSRFTDDTVMTLAIARAILEDRDYARHMRELGRRYPRAGYGASFFHWLWSREPRPYGSWGNGSAMRVSPVAMAMEKKEDVLREAASTAIVTHDHPEGIKGAQATALAIWLARKTHDREAIKEEIQRTFGYDLSRTLDEIRPFYFFDVSCQGTVPEAIICFLESSSWEDAVRNAISLGGDSDTLGCIAGAIAEAYYGEVPREIRLKVKELLTPELRDILERFYAKFSPLAALW
jgi:ADP-ribosylglycohydrolase